MVYLGLYSALGLIVGLGIYLGKDDNDKLMKYTLMAGLFFLLINFPVGQDLGAYNSIYTDRINYFNNGIFSNIGRNIAFNIVILISYFLKMNFVSFRFILNIICLVLCFYTINKYSKNKLLSLMIFFGSGIYLIYYGSGIRQMISMSVFLFCYCNYLIKDKYLSYFIGSILSVLFHELGFICFFVMFVNLFSKLIYKHKVVSIIVAILFVCIGHYYVSWYMNALYHKYYYIQGIFGHILHYFSIKEIDVFGVLLRSILVCIDVIFFYLAKNKTETDNEMLLTIISSFCVYLIFCNYSVFSRIYDFLAIVELIMIPNLIMKIDNKNVKFCSFIVIFLLNFVLFFADINVTVNSEFVSQFFNLYNYPVVSIFDLRGFIRMMGIV